MFRIAREAIVFSAILVVIGHARAQGTKPPKVSSIEVRGNKTLNRASILAAAGLKVGDVATPAVLEAARRSLLATGNFGMRRISNPEEAVKLSVTDVNLATNEGKLLIEVEENDVVQGFNISGVGPIPPREVLAQLQTKPGFVLNINTLRADVDRIQRYYDSRGYIANVSEEGFGLTDGILAFPIIVGRVGTIVFKGLSPAQRAEFRKLIRLKPGDYYNAREFERAYRKMFRKDIFEDIQPSILTPQPATVNLILNFIEKK